MNTDAIIKKYREKINYLSKAIPEYDYQLEKRKSARLRNAYFTICGVVFILALKPIGLFNSILIAFVSGLVVLFIYMLMNSLFFYKTIEENEHLKIMQQELILIENFINEIEIQEELEEVFNNEQI